MKPRLKKVFSDFDSGINRSSIQGLLKQTDEIKDMQRENIRRMAQNVETTESLLGRSENIKGYAKDLEKGTAELDTMMRNQNWWCCSKWCLIIFGTLAAIIAIGIVTLVIVA